MQYCIRVFGKERENARLLTPFWEIDILCENRKEN